MDLLVHLELSSLTLTLLYYLVLFAHHYTNCIRFSNQNKWYGKILDQFNGVVRFWKLKFKFSFIIHYSPIYGTYDFEIEWNGEGYINTYLVWFSMIPNSYCLSFSTFKELSVMISAQILLVQKG